MADHASEHSNSTQGTVGEIIRNEPRNQAILNVDDYGEISVSVEEPWNTELENQLRQWRTQAQEKANQHDEAGYNTKSKHRFLGLIVLVHNAAIFITNALIHACTQHHALKITIAVLSGLNIIWSSLYTWLDYGSRSKVHWFYQQEYQSYVTDIDSMLVRHRDFRVPADAFLTEMRERLKTLLREPELPLNRFIFC